ncbi:MAG: hypothetical protein LBP22_05340 [Deltaproteobacteria bacterium]|nr:hypothetical protein [Deltaproteobacteria bacterium]
MEHPSRPVLRLVFHNTFSRVLLLQPESGYIDGGIAAGVEGFRNFGQKLRLESSLKATVGQPFEADLADRTGICADEFLPWRQDLASGLRSRAR